MPFGCDISSMRYARLAREGIYIISQGEALYRNRRLYRIAEQYIAKFVWPPLQRTKITGSIILHFLSILTHSPLVTLFIRRKL